jgi:glycosyltransferase involved in cell wall biosynthesis
MKENPLISIVLPVHNGRKYLRQAIESCLNQTYKNIELIIIDDGSTDDSLLIASEFLDSDKRVKVISNEENLNLPASLNIGHRKAQGDFITWTSDDNMYQKDAIKKLYQTLIKKSVDIVYCDYLIIDDEDKLVGQARLKDIEFLLFDGIIGACFLYKKEVYERNNGYNEKLFLVEDYDFWLRALKHSCYYKIENPGYYFYRYHTNSLTVRMQNDHFLKDRFIKNLRSLYLENFSDLKIKDINVFIEILVNRFLNGPNADIKVLKSKTFFNDLNTISESFSRFSYKKSKRIFLNDAIETILKNKKFQKVSVLFKLHKCGKSELLQLSANRYLALFKKCLF